MLFRSNNNQVGGTYDILRKVSEKDIREAINRYGLSNEATDDVKAVAREMTAEEFEKMTHDRMPVFEMDNRALLHVQYNKDADTLDVGTVTNVGMKVQHSFTYDHFFTLDSNLQGIHEQLSEMEEYQKEENEVEQESQVAEQEYHFRRGR